jgi:hypothetical protein
MAHVDRIWFHGTALKENTMKVYIQLQPAGEVAIDVAMPKDFRDCILRMAQAAADKIEQEMRARILADNQEKTP